MAFFTDLHNQLQISTTTSLEWPGKTGKQISVKIPSFIVILCEKIKKRTRFYEGKKTALTALFERKFLLHFATEVSFGSAALTTAKTTWEWPPPPPQNERRKKKRCAFPHSKDLLENRKSRDFCESKQLDVSLSCSIPNSMLMTVRLECWQGTGYDCFRDAEAEEDERRRSRLSDFIAFAHAAKRGKCGASEAIYAWPLSSYLDLKHKFIFKRVWRWPLHPVSWFLIFIHFLWVFWLQVLKDLRGYEARFLLFTFFFVDPHPQHKLKHKSDGSCSFTFQM